MLNINNSNDFINKIKIPTLTDLIDRQNEQNFLYPNPPENLQHVVDLLQSIPEFYLYSIASSGDPDFEIPFSIYGNIPFFLRFLLEKESFETIKKVFDFLENMYLSNNKYTKDLLISGVLENFNTISDIMPDLIPYISDNIRDILERKDF